VIFYREFTYTIAQCIDEFGYDNCSITVAKPTTVQMALA